MGSGKAAGEDEEEAGEHGGDPTEGGELGSAGGERAPSETSPEEVAEDEADKEDGEEAHRDEVGEDCVMTRSWRMAGA